MPRDYDRLMLEDLADEDNVSSRVRQAALEDGWTPLPEQAPEPVATPAPEEPGVLRQAADYAKGSARTIGRIAGASYEAFGEGIAGAVEGVADISAAGANNPLGYVFSTKLAETAGKARKEFHDVGQLILPDAELAEQPWFAQQVVGGLRSFFSQAPGVAASILTRSPVPALATMGVFTAGTSYGRAKDAGLPLAQRVAFATSDGGWEVLTEAAPVGVLLKALDKAPGFWKTAAEFAAKDIGGEEVAMLAQGFNDFATLHPEKPLGEFVATLPEQAAATFVSTVVAAGAQVGLFRILQAAGEPRREPKEKAPDLIDQLENENIQSEIEQTQQAAREQAAAQGGDALDQELAAATETVNRTGDARGAKIGAMVDALTTAKEQAAAVQKQIEIDQAYAQRDEAKAAPALAQQELQSAAVQPEVGGETGPATLADVWPTAPAAEPTAPQAAAPKTVMERRAIAAEQPLALPAPKTGPTITAPEFRTGKKGQRLKGTAPVTKEGGGAVVVNQRGEAQVLSENTPTVPGVKTGYGTLAIRRQAIQEERVRTPVVETTRAEVDKAAAEAAASPQNDLAPPTPAQHVAGNYKVGRTQVHGLDVSIEYPKGSQRPFVNEAGEQVGERTMPGHYGYVRGTIDTDGQPTDVLIGEQPESPQVFVVDQLKDDGGFEQHKVLLGYPNQLAATRALKKAYPGKPVGPITTMTPDELKTWLKEGDTTKPLKPAEIPAAKQTVRAEKSEPQERPIAKPKPGKVSVQAPAPVVEAESVVKTLAERRAQEAKREASRQADQARRAILGRDERRTYKAPSESAASAKNATVEDTIALMAERRAEKARRKIDEAAEKSKNAIRRSAKPKNEPPKDRLRFSEGPTELTPKWKRTTQKDGTARWDYGSRGSVTERVNEAGESEYVAEATLRTEQGLTRRESTFTDKQTAAIVEKLLGENPEFNVGPSRAAKAENTFTLDAVALAKAFVERAERTNSALQNARNRRERDATAEKTGPRPMGVPINRARTLTAQMQKALGESFVLLERPSQAPSDVYAEMERRGKLNAPGVFDTQTGKVYMFAENNPTEEFLERKVAHEVVNHLGVRKLLGLEKHAQVVEEVFQTAENRTWIQEFLTQHGLDENDASARATAGDEYMSMIAEEQSEPGLLNRVIAMVRTALRKFGFVSKWTDNDIRNLLIQSQSNLDKISGHAWHHPNQTPRLFFATQPTPPNANDTGPEGIKIRQDMTLEALLQDNRTILRQGWDYLRQMAHKGKDSGLAFIHLSNLPDFVQPGKMDSAGKYYLTATDQNGFFNQFLAKYAPMTRELGAWYRKNIAVADELGNIIHASTIAGPDPSLPYRPRYSGMSNGKPVKLSAEQEMKNRQWQKQYQILRTAWDRLDRHGAAGKQAKQFYTQIRDAYADLNTQVWKALEARITSTSAGESQKSKLLDALRKEFESIKVPGVYFALFRKGDYWAVAKKKVKNEETGKMEERNEFAVRSDSEAEMELWIKQMNAEGFRAFGGESTAITKDTMKDIDPNFVAKIVDLTQEFDEPEIADEVWQLYLKHLPEMSMRKHHIHRLNRLGFTKDYVQAFSHTMFHGAHQLARLRYGHQLNEHLRNAEKELRVLQENNDPEKRIATPVLRELKRRHKWVNNPTTAGWANWLTTIGFLHQLSVAPAPGIVNLTQFPVVTWPELMAEHGANRATREFLRAGKQALRVGKTSDALEGWEKEAMLEGDRRGLFTSTNIGTMVSIGERGVMAGTKSETAIRAAGYPFQAPEVYIREATYLASIRLWRMKHPATAAQNTADAAWRNAKDEEQKDALWPATSMAKAARYAQAKVTSTQGDYSNFNRPRILQGNLPKVMGIFRSYGLFMAYRMVRDFKRSAGLTKQFDNETAAEFKQRKHEARVRFGATLGQVGLWAGMRGLPLYWLMQMVANAFLGDDDDPMDIDSQMAARLEDFFTERYGPEKGKLIAQAIMEGSVSTLFRGALSARMGMNNMFLQEPPENKYGGDLALWYAMQVTGFFGSLAYNIADAVNPKVEGYEDRAIERIVPKWMRDPWKATRYAKEGVTTKQGDVVVPRSELSNYEIGLQASGFQPLDVKWQYEKNRSILAEAEKIDRRQGGIRNRWLLAREVEDEEAMAEAWAEAEKFDAKHPERPIIPGLRDSLKQRARRSAESVNGVYVDRRLRQSLMEKHGSRPPPEEEPADE